MALIRWWREWRAWVRSEKELRELELERSCRAVLEGPGVIEYQVRDVIAHVRWFDKHESKF